MDKEAQGPSQNTAPENTSTSTAYSHDYIEVLGAREHNLQNIDVKLPRNKLIVFTGVSGSGKSSLAFDTIYAEGQRRYMESFAAYARSFIGNMERPDVDKINGLSPVIAIEQKTTSKNPRSTVGTATEIYDFLRLLFTKASDAYSHLSGQKMVKQTEAQIQSHLLQTFARQRVTLLAPIVKGRKGHYRELVQQVSGLGFSKVRVDGKVQNISRKMQLDRYKTHDIEIVIDRLVVSEDEKQRLKDSLEATFKQGKGSIMLQDAKGVVHYFSKALVDPATGLSYDEPAPNIFSFNSPYGACPHCNGLGEMSQIDVDAIIPDKSLSISEGGIAPLGPYREVAIYKKITALLREHNLQTTTAIQELPEKVLELILHGCDAPLNIAPTRSRLIELAYFEGVIDYIVKRSAKENSKIDAETLFHVAPCSACHGGRLKKESQHFKVHNKNIADLASMDIRELHNWFQGLESHLSKRQLQIATELLKEIRKRLCFLLDVGLDYLHLNRPLRTLSGGESQRIRLATQIGTQLVSVLYILDEPSIGLHQRDNARLIKALKDLRDIGNSILVVEHDKDIMLHSDYLVDIGPGAGRNGGKVVAAGSPEEFLQQRSTTADFLTGKQQIAVPSQRREGTGKQLIITGCRGNNLKDVTLKLPLGKFICVTGVSGSGKSSLIHETLFPILKRHVYKSHATPLPYTAVQGLKHIDKVVEVDQSPIGRTPRSSPATYTGVFTDIRMLFSELPEAKIRGYKPGRFSFNVKSGRCETCEGGGMKLIEMDFLPNVHVSCEACKAKRYNRETLEVQYRGKSISDVLEMTVDKAIEFFEKYPRILRKVKTIQEVGLGYMTLGQHATTLSGGEAQRVKLATELSKRDTGQTFYILDEPTTGLHFQDIQHLLTVLNQLVDKGNTVLVVEHNLDIIKVADHIIDIGPEGGQKGGQIVIEGTPEQVAQHPDSHTARFLKEELALSKH
ncbi:MAG: excinuclease ABC subunit UvrA [Bacteroidota bacterium]